MIYGNIKSSPWRSINIVAEMWNNRYYLLEINSDYFYLIEMFEDKSYNKVYLSDKEGQHLISELNLIKVSENFDDVWITAKQIIGRIEQKQEIINQKSIDDILKVIRSYQLCIASELANFKTL